MRFVDLFAGLGGFHIALKRLGHECVMASEIDSELQEVYRKNFSDPSSGGQPSFPVMGDIREISPADFPEHDILCAGFPCQPFSKAGSQKGLDCPQWGGLFEFVIQAIDHCRPSYFILENVPNIKKHDGGKTWQLILDKLNSPEWGYKVDHREISPHEFGIPQIRKRIFIVGSRKEDRGLGWFGDFPPPMNTEPNIRNVLDETPDDARKLPEHYLKCLDVWQEFINQLVAREELPSFPVWAMEFGATYPYQRTTPYACDLHNLQNYKGSFGVSLRGKREKELADVLPSHALRPQNRFPAWKQNFLRENRALYERNKDWLDEWIPKINVFPTSLQKLEWNCKGGEPDIWKYVLQFRSSGVRVKRPTTAPSLIAMTTTQVPIIAWEQRFMTLRECARLQEMDTLDHLPNSASAAYKALGNAVNSTLVTFLSAALLNHELPEDLVRKWWRSYEGDGYPGRATNIELSDPKIPLYDS